MTSNPSLMANPIPADWFRFAGDCVELKTGKVELGQGIGIALLQIASDELTIPIEEMRVTAGDTDSTPNELWTSASISIEVGGSAVRTVASDVRERFRAAAARRLNIASGDVLLEAGFFTGPAGGLSLRYCDLAEQVDLRTPVNPDAAPLGIIGAVGRPLKRPDLPEKLTSGGFIHDIDLPDMLHARVVLPPRPGCQLMACDDDAIRALPGVHCLVRDGAFVGIAAEREEDAIGAAEKAEVLVHWKGSELPPFMPTTELLERFDATPDAVCGDETESRHEYDLHFRFSRPFIAHGSVGLVCALARFDDGRLTIWSQSQGVFPLRDAIAKTLAMEARDVRVIHAPGAGCYGHNGADDVALDAALIARATNRPVRLVWTRAQEFQAAPAGPAMQVDLHAGLDHDGRVAHWTHTIKGFTHLTRPGWGEGVNLASAWTLEQHQEPSPIADPGQIPFGGAGCRNAPPIYAVPAAVAYALIKERPFRTSALRALGAHLNVFAIESMMDELAEIAGRDPLDFRLAHLDEDRAKAVLTRVADMAGWPPVPSDGSTGKGLGMARYKNSAAYCAIVADLELDETVRVARVWAAVDAGCVINPDGLRNQIEGGILQSISWTLKEALSWGKAGFDAPDWDAYPVLRFDEIPDIEVELIEAPGRPSLGAGECATGPTAAALGNALKQALGVRIVDMPLTLDKIVQALA